MAEKIIKVDGEIGRVQKGPTKYIIVRENEFKGHKGIDIREWYETVDGMQYTAKGVWVNVKFWDDLKKVIDKVKVKTK